MQSSGKTKKPILSIVVPCYNEKEIIADTILKLSDYLGKLKEQKQINDLSFLCFVDDGSKDNTLELLQAAQNTNKHVSVVKLSKNFGHQAALLAGMEFCVSKCDYSVSIDADLQDDIETIGLMLEKVNLGAEIVFGVRNNRDTDSLFKKATAHFFYNIMHVLGASTLKNHADFRLLSQRAITYLFKYQEVNLFLRGIVPEIGLQTDVVYYKRKKREAGETKYPLRKMIAFAVEGITSFSVKPLRFVTLLGLSIIVISIFVGIYIFLSISSESVVRGWASQIISIWFLGGIQLFSIGILGEYIGKIYKETKGRPRYHVAEIYSNLT